VKVEDDAVTVPFELVRLKKGDYQVMYNVYFYKDAGIMRPESKYEVNALLDMMKENPKYKIRIHGHTNGNAHGKVISLGESQNFFALTADVKTGFGSAKKLSEERAKVIREYLIKQGIDPKRLEVKAWGGKRPIYEGDHAQAHSNVRVEIEIIED
jgi:outer membrane protein OmpA-like peptidoglycan-associated protein